MGLRGTWRSRRRAQVGTSHLAGRDFCSIHRFSRYFNGLTAFPAHAAGCADFPLGRPASDAPTRAIFPAISILSHVIAPHPASSQRGRISSGDAHWDDSSQGADLYDGFIAAAVAEAIAEGEPLCAIGASTMANAWYCWHASRRQAMLEACWEKAGAFVHQQIIWVKDRGVLTRSHYLWKHEP
jgi:hypothetical protein